MLAVNGVTFLVSAALLRTVPFGSSVRAAGDGEPAQERESLLSSMTSGTRSAVQTPGVRTLLLIGTAQSNPSLTAGRRRVGAGTARRVSKPAPHVCARRKRKPAPHVCARRAWLFDQ